MKCGAAAHTSGHMRGPPVENSQQPFRNPGFQFRGSFLMEIQTGLPHPLGHMDEVENNPRIVAFFVEALAEDLKLRFVAIDQRHPSLVSFRIPHSRFAKGFLDDFLGRLFQTRPNPFVFRPRPARSFPRVLRRQTADNILRRPAIGLDRIDRRDRCHAFRVPLLAATEPVRQLVPRRFGLLLRRLPQILMTHHDSFPIHRDHHDWAALLPWPETIPLLIERIEVFGRSDHQLLDLPFADVGSGRFRQHPDHLVERASGSGPSDTPAHFMRVEFLGQIQVRIHRMQTVHAFGDVTRTFDSHLAEHGFQSTVMQALLHAFFSIGPLPPALPPRPDRAPRYALPKAAASTRGHASLVLSPNRFLSSCRPPSSPETSRSRRSFHELGQTRRDSLQAGPTPLSTPSIAEQRHAPGDKSAPSWAPPLRHGDADPAVPSRWFDPIRSSWPHGNTCRDSASDPPASRPTAAPHRSTVSSPRLFAGPL